MSFSERDTHPELVRLLQPDLHHLGLLAFLEEVASDSRHNLECSPDFLKRIRESLAYDEERLLQLQSAIRLLKLSRQDTLSRISLCKAALSPIRNLPPEVLYIIFGFAQAGDYLRELDTRGATTSWMIAHVCRRWMDISTQTQAVRCKNIIIEIHPTDRECRIFSRSLPSSAAETSFHHYEFTEILQFVGSYCGKWIRIILEGPAASEAFCQDLRSLHSKLNSLSSLEIRDSCGERGVRGNAEVNVTQTCPGVDLLSQLIDFPMLQALSGSPHSILLIPLAFHRIKRLTVLHPVPTTEYCDADVLHLLRSMPFLEHCSLSCILVETDSETLSDVRHEGLVHSALRSLEVVGFAWNILVHLQCPVLEALSIDSPISRPWSSSILHIFLTKSARTLMHLRVSGDIEFPMIDEWLPANLPLLVSLELDCWSSERSQLHHPEALIQALIPCYPKMLLPSLSSLNISVPEDQYFLVAEKTILSTMRQSRLGLSFIFESSSYL
jgi:hypothetical protein